MPNNFNMAARTVSMQQRFDGSFAKQFATRLDCMNQHVDHVRVCRRRQHMESRRQRIRHGHSNIRKSV